MDKERNRRSFLKTGVLLGGGAALAQTCLPKAAAQEKQTDSTKYPNETIKTIHSVKFDQGTACGITGIMPYWHSKGR